MLGIPIVGSQKGIVVEETTTHSLSSSGFSILTSERVTCKKRG